MFPVFITPTYKWSVICWTPIITVNSDEECGEMKWRKHGSRCLLIWWDEVLRTEHKDEQMSAVSFISVRRSLCSRCWQREHLLVNKSIFAKVTICFMALFLSLSLSIPPLLCQFSTLFLSVHSPSLSHYCEEFLSLVDCSQTENTTDCSTISIQ